MNIKQLHLHFQDPPHDEQLEYLKTHLNSNVTFTSGISIPDTATYQILVAGRPTRELLEASELLEYLIVPWAGIPPATHELLGEYPHLRVHNLHYNGSSTAEFAMALLLAAAKKLIPIDRAFREHDWTDRYRPNSSILLEGRQALVLGYGEIGRRIGRMCQGFGIKVVAVRRSIDSIELDGEIQIYPVCELNKILVTSNVLLVCVPETLDTRGMIGKEELDRLPKDSILVNVARGAVVDEKALFEALASRQLAAAGLDVWYQYPENEGDRSSTQPSVYPFHELDNVIMSPHRAGGWTESGLGRMQHLVHLLNRFATGDPMQNRVDLERGY